MAALQFDESLVRVIEDRGLDAFGVEAVLGAALVRGGWVTSDYVAALHERERRFPTGLDMRGLNVAIPHGDPDHVVRSALCVGVLRHPVSWGCMDDASKRCDVTLVAMLALRESHAHLEMLQRIVALAQDQDLVAQLAACDASGDAFRLLEHRLL